MNPHPDPEDLEAYARSSETMLPVRAASVEQHLFSCTACRSAVSTATPVGFVQDSWTRVADVIDRPPRRVVASVVDRSAPGPLRSAGLGNPWAAVGMACVDDRTRRGRRVVQPRRRNGPPVPVDRSARRRCDRRRETFAPAGEPGGEASYATPVFGLGLILRRLVAALVPALIVLALLAMLVADLDVDSLVWLLPAVGLVSMTLALSTFVAIPVAAGGASTVWVAAVVLTGRTIRFAASDRWSRHRRVRSAQSAGRSVVDGRRSPGHLAPQGAHRHPGGHMVNTQEIRLVGVSKRFGSTVALDDISIELRSGITGLLGPNGAGKTTLLRILATVLAPDRGDIDIFGLRPDRANGRAEIRRNLGYTPQEPGFHRSFTTFEFVDYLAILKEWGDRNRRRDEVRRVIALVGLETQMHVQIKKLSGGMRRRVSRSRKR